MHRYEGGIGSSSNGVPPISLYTVSKYDKELGGYVEVHHPQWDKYEFHMTSDHPINAKKYREDLDKQLKDGHITKEQHETDMSNSKHREKAVQHIIYGGIVKDENHDVFVHGNGIHPDSINEYRDGGNIAHFNAWKLIGDPFRRQSFHETGHHKNHIARQKKKQQARIDEIQEMTRNLGLGKHIDAENFEPSHHSSVITPPPSPPPASPPREQKGKDKVFGYKVWH